MQCNAIWYHIIPCNVMWCYILYLTQCNIMQYNYVQCDALQCNAMWFNQMYMFQYLNFNFFYVRVDPVSISKYIILTILCSFNNPSQVVTKYSLLFLHVEKSVIRYNWSHGKGVKFHHAHPTWDYVVDKRPGVYTRQICLSDWLAAISSRHIGLGGCQ